MKNENNKTKVHALILSNEDEKRLTKITEEARLILSKTKNPQEIAFCLRILIESFEDCYKCVVPFKNRYTEPTWNYQEKYFKKEKTVDEITESIYNNFGSGTGVLFGVPSSLKESIKSIIKLTLEVERCNKDE